MTDSVLDIDDDVPSSLCCIESSQFLLMLLVEYPSC
jgi:hypothetical protein